jgi:long-chain acyl-CoA synthetase
MGSNKPGIIGIPLPGNDMKIVNIDTKEEVPTGEVGEICIAGPVVMPGYLDNEKETNEMLEKDEKGTVWVHTGDLGFMDEDGLLHYVQRLKRMLIVSGYNVYPSHVENILMEHPAVLNCGVIGIPHPYKVQVPKAFIVLNAGFKADNALKVSEKYYELKDEIIKKIIDAFGKENIMFQLNNKGIYTMYLPISFVTSIIPFLSTIK